MSDDIQPPDWENPPCPACYAIDVDPDARLPTTPEELARDRRAIYAGALTEGFLRCRINAKAWRLMCLEHREVAQAAVEAVCDQLHVPRAKVYEDLGLPMPDTKPVS